MTVSVADAMALIGEYMDQFGYDAVNQLTTEDLEILSDQMEVRVADVARMLSLSEG